MGSSPTGGRLPLWLLTFSPPGVPNLGVSVAGCVTKLRGRTLRKLSSGFSDTLAEWSTAVDSSSTIFGCVGSNPTGVTFERHKRKVFTMTALLLHLRAQCLKMTAVGFEPTPLRTGALSQRLRPLGQTVLPAVPRPIKTQTAEQKEAKLATNPRSFLTCTCPSARRHPLRDSNPQSSD